jgi:hypothetical protein
MENDLEKMTTGYNEILSTILDKHAPNKSRKITLRPHAPWFNDELRKEKRKKRRCERKLLSSGLVVHKEIYQEQCRKYKQLIDASKADYYKRKVAETDQTKLFRIVDRILKVKSIPKLPSHDSTQVLVESFSQYFESKIVNLRHELSDTGYLTINDNQMNTTSDAIFSSFHPVSPTLVRRTIMSSLTKSCPLHPIPTSILKECIDSLLPCITRIINISLSQGTYPSIFKNSLIRPVLKKKNFGQ